jgi:histidinol-phosphate aminotransferase
MPAFALSRRQFGRNIGGTLALAVAGPKLAALCSPAAVTRKRATRPDNAIRLDSNENPYGPCPQAFEAINQSGRIAARYPDDAAESLKKAIAKMHGVEPENVALGCGSTEILRASDQAFLGPTKNAVAAEPTYETVLSYAHALDADTVKIPLTADYRHDLTRMAAACTSHTGVVYVCNPNNPTGTTVTKEELATFCQRVPATTTILIDEAYFHFIDGQSNGSAIGWFGRYPNVMVVRTFSKVYGLAGMRLGYAIGTRNAIQVLSEYLTYANANAAVVAAALASLGDSNHIAECRERILETRQWLCDQLAKEGRRTLPSEANFVMIDLDGDVQPVIEKFQARNIFVGRKFPSMGTWLRVTIGTRPEMETFLAAFREIAPARAAQAA